MARKPDYGVWCIAKAHVKQAVYVAEVSDNEIIAMCRPCAQMLKRFYPKPLTRISQDWKPPSGWTAIVYKGKVRGARSPSAPER